MKVVSFTKPLPISNPESFLDLTTEPPAPQPRDLLVEVRAISVNPVDAKIRAGGGPAQMNGAVPILGWDAAGVVKACGAEVTRFKVGDAVYYAGSLDRPGSYAQLQCVDERLVGRKPGTLDFAEAAALPLTTITAWELLFDRFKVGQQTTGCLLIVGGAGGVGSIAIQLARQLTALTVIATASRPQSAEWCRRMGAHHVVDHAQPLAGQVKTFAPDGVNYVLALTRTEDHFDELIEAMAPQSALGLIESPARPLDVTKLKPKSIALHWEFMFTRSRYQTADMGEQGRLLDKAADLVDAGRVRSTMSEHLGPINAANIRRAHALVEKGATTGKLVLSPFE